MSDTLSQLASTASDVLPIPMVPTHWIDTTPVESTDRPATIAALDVRAQVSGLYADVTETITIANPNKRPISVPITLPMPDAAVVCGYALEIDGQMIDGVVVPKDKARVAFETEQRKGADPGLVEAVKGNVYRTRVYPVPAEGARRISLRYVAPLQVVGGTGAFLDLPMPAEQLAKRDVCIDVELLDCPAPQLSGINDARFEERGCFWSVESHEQDVAAGESVRVALPVLPNKFALVERDADGTAWFVASELVPQEGEKSSGDSSEVAANIGFVACGDANATPNVKSSAGRGSNAAASATRGSEPFAITGITVLWDTSGSRAGMSHDREIELLRSCCADEGIASYRLISFSDHAEPVRTFATADELVACIESLRYDGGSDFQALARALAELDSPATEAASSSAAGNPSAQLNPTEAASRSAAGNPSAQLNPTEAASRSAAGNPSAQLNPTEAFVLFSDGMDTLSDEPAALADGRKILAVVSGAERDVETLRQACGGLVYDLLTAPADAAALARTLFASQLLSAVTGEGVADIQGIGSGTDGRYTVVGRLTAEVATISFADTDSSFDLDASSAREGATLARAWAALRVAQLSPRADDHADELLEIGQRFGVASPATSLLVLETLDQWLRYDIEPPATWERMHDEWQRARAGVMNVSSDEELADRHLGELRREWSKLRQWWETEYPVHSTSEPGRANFCTQCGAPVSPRDRFCANCGAELPRPGVFEGIGAALGGLRHAIHSAGHFADAGMANRSTPYPDDGMPAPDLGDGMPAPDLGDGMAAPNLFGSMPDMAAGAATPRAMMAMEDTGMDRGAEYFDAVMEEPAEAPANSGNASAATVSVKPWMPEAAYLTALDQAYEAAEKQGLTADRQGTTAGKQDSPTKQLAASQQGTAPVPLSPALVAARDAYFAQRAEYASSPAFFIDCAGWFFAKNDRAFGVQVLTNLAELRIEDAALLRVMAWRLREADDLERALVALRRVLRLRGEDSQSHRDLALVLDELARKAFAAGNEDAARAYAEEAAGFYRTIALTPWQRRATAVGLFAVEEYNVLRAWAERQSWKQPPALEPLDAELEGVLDCDLRVTLAWDADETDVDLHVTEPNGEEAYYGHRLTYQGGRVSEDITDGYGPELYEIRHTKPGSYKIRAHYFASHQQTVFGPASCTLTVYTDWGRPTQRQQITSTRLELAKEMIDVGTAVYEG